MKTAVEWLIEKIATKDNSYQAMIFYFDHEKEIEEAKQMEKEQIIDAFINYFYDEYMPLNDKRALYKRAEQYYNETYNKEG